MANFPELPGFDNAILTNDVPAQLSVFTWGSTFFGSVCDVQIGTDQSLVDFEYWSYSEMAYVVEPGAFVG